MFTNRHVSAQPPLCERQRRIQMWALRCGQIMSEWDFLLPQLPRQPMQRAVCQWGAMQAGRGLPERKVLARGMWGMSCQHRVCQLVWLWLLLSVCYTDLQESSRWAWCHRKVPVTFLKCQSMMLNVCLCTHAFTTI